jgi:hypothetical protein
VLGGAPLGDNATVDPIARPLLLRRESIEQAVKESLRQLT